MSPDPNPDVSSAPTQAHEPAGKTPSTLVQNWITLGVAFTGFVLFIAAALAFRSVSRLDSPDLGIAMWMEQPVTQSRLKPVVESLLKQSGLAASMARSIDPSWLKSTEDPPKIWDAMNDAAEALVTAESQARLAAKWAAELQGEAARTVSLTQLRAYRMSPISSTAPTDAIAKEYEEALTSVKVAWIASELPTPVIEGFLLKNGITVKPVEADAKRNVSARTGVQRLEDLAMRVRAAIAEAWPSPVVGGPTAPGGEPTHAVLREELHRAIGADLELASAQAALVKAVDQDFAARWLWTLAAAIFLTAAASAIAGSAWRTWKLSAGGSRAWPVAFYVGAVIAGICYGLTRRGRLPDFLSRPSNDFARLYNIQLENTTLLINTVTAVAVATLVVSAWTSFLITSRNDDRDEHLETRLATLRWSFHTATFVLVAGVVYLDAFLQWPSVFMSEAPAGLVQSGAKIAALALGAVFSTVLLLIYLPASSVLVSEARARKNAAMADEARVKRIDGMLEQNGFAGPPMQQVLRFVQLFAPLLIAPLGEQVATFLGS